MSSLTTHIESSIIPGRTDCSEGYILWPIDSTCHRPFYQGPCGPNQVLIDHQQGPYCEFIGNNAESENGEIFPSNKVEDLRKISGTKMFSKIYKALLSLG